jgi:hypothetical protein
MVLAGFPQQDDGAVASVVLRRGMQGTTHHGSLRFCWDEVTPGPQRYVLASVVLEQVVSPDTCADSAAHS